MNPVLAKLVLCLIVAAYGVATGMPRLVRGCGAAEGCGPGSALVLVESRGSEVDCPLCVTSDVADEDDPGRKPTPCCPPGCLCCLALPPGDVPGPGIEAPARERQFVPFAVHAERRVGVPLVRDTGAAWVSNDAGPPQAVTRSLRSWRLVV